MRFKQTIMVQALTSLFAPLKAYAESNFALSLTPRDVHIDGPLSNIAVEAFDSGDFIGMQLFPSVPVAKQSDRYYTITRNSWMRTPTSALRAPKTSPIRVEFDVSSDTYFCDNFALAAENSFETLANADAALQVRARTTRFLVEQLMRVQEFRVANQVTSISNVGSGVVLAGGDRWSQYGSADSDPVADVNTAHAFIRNATGIVPNTMVMDWDTHAVLQRHPVMLDMYKYTQGGLVNDAELRAVFKVDRLLISNSRINRALENAASSMVNIWGNNCVLAYVGAPGGLRTQTFGLSFQWTSPDLPAAFAVRVYNDPDPGRKVEITEVGHYQDEVIVARDLAYCIQTTI